MLISKLNIHFPWFPSSSPQFTIYKFKLLTQRNTANTFFFFFSSGLSTASVFLFCPSVCCSSPSIFCCSDVGKPCSVTLMNARHGSDRLYDNQTLFFFFWVGSREQTSYCCSLCPEGCKAEQSTWVNFQVVSYNPRGCLEQWKRCLTVWLGNPLGATGNAMCWCHEFMN